MSILQVLWEYWASHFRLFYFFIMDLDAFGGNLHLERAALLPVFLILIIHGFSAWWLLREISICVVETIVRLIRGLPRIPLDLHVRESRGSYMWRHRIASCRNLQLLTKRSRLIDSWETPFGWRRVMLLLRDNGMKSPWSQLHWLLSYLLSPFRYLQPIRLY